MSPAADLAAGVVSIVSGLLLAGAGLFWAVAQMATIPQGPVDTAGESDQLTPVIPLADLEPKSARRELPGWVDDPTAYFGEFLDIADRMPDLDDRFVEIMANPEESR